MKKLNWRNYVIATLTLTTVVINPIPHAAAQEIPKAECKSAYGETKCGYNCVSAYGEIKCAEWPGGVCKEAYGEIVCGPTAPANWTGYTSPSGTANPPEIKWRIVKHNISLQECQQKAYQAMQTANFINLKTGGNSNSGYILQGDINNNRAKISCQNDTVFIVVAGNDPKTVNKLRDSIYQNMGFR